MATNKLADSMAVSMQNYISGLPTPKEDNYNFQNGYRSIFNKTEDYWNEIVEIDNDYSVPENKGNLTIIIKSTGVTADPGIELPLLSTNIGRRLFFINENASYRVSITSKFSSSDTIEGYNAIDIMQAPHKNRIELIATSYGWIRKAREFVSIPENVRPSGWVLLSGTSTTWADVSFLTWVQEGATTLLLRFAIFQIGNSINDRSAFLLRPKGSIIDDVNKNIVLSIFHTNLATGITLGYADQVIIDCDKTAIIQYRQLVPSNGQLYLTINGYWK